MKKIFKLLVYICAWGFFLSWPAHGEESYENWTDRIILYGLIEVEGGYEKIDFHNPAIEDEDSSDIVLATFELGVSVDITDYVSGEVLLLYEEDETEPMDVDEAFILLDGKERLPMFLKAGKMVLPFGVFESYMISDPLTLELGESHETAVDIGFHLGGFWGSLYIFNGEMDKKGEDKIDNFGINAGYSMTSDRFSIDLGAGYINSLIDSDVLTDEMDLIEETAEANGMTIFPRDYSGAYYTQAFINVGNIAIIGEYMASVEDQDFNVSNGQFTFVETMDSLKAWNLELGITYELVGRETTLAIGYQGSDSDDWLPETRIIGTIGMGLFDRVRLALEYLHDTFENDDEADIVTVQLALEF